MVGRTLGPYEVVAKLGEGGMGEVYRARDSKLGRDVAIKILPEAFASEPERLARFEREARTLASLNHPNIAHVHAVEDRALVMELVEGEDLAQRIARGPIPLDEALSIARQIADALEAAHEQGIVHRDLKPANIKLRADGMVKVLDFGLAKAMETGSGIRQPGSGPTLADSPTMAHAGTMAGMILGTAAYMSPEQAAGKPVDKRSDLWAFGVVLLEMLTGRPVFTGETTSHVLASVLKSDPDWSGLPADTPPTIHRLLRRCLEKDRKRRLADAADARLEIEEAIAGPPAATAATATPAPAATPSWSRALPWGLLALVSVAAVMAIARGSAMTTSASPVVSRALIDFPQTAFSGARLGNLFAVAPDGTRIVFVGNPDGQNRLYLRRLDQFDATPIPGTESALQPFFAPDGHSVGFFASGKLKRVSLAGGPPATLADAPDPQGGAWGEDETIVFGPDPRGLMKIAAGGGAVERLTQLSDNAVRHAWPTFLPGGKAVVYTSTTTAVMASIDAVSLTTGHVTRLAESGCCTAYASSGHLVYAHPGSGAIFAVPFNSDRVELIGKPTQVMEGVMSAATFGGQFGVSKTGSLVYLANSAATEWSFAWVDRAGRSTPVDLGRRAWGAPSLSPDGRRLAAPVYDGLIPREIWTADLDSGTASRLIAGNLNSSPIWARDGSRLAFSSMNEGGGQNLYSVRADGSATVERLTTNNFTQVAHDWSADGRTVVFYQRDAVSGFDLWTLTLDAERTTKPWVVTPFNELAARFSPDGRYIAYISDRTGRFEVYVQPFPGPGEVQQVSTDGGSEPVWASNGRELFFRQGEKMMVAGVTTVPAFTASRPRVLFEGRYEVSFLVPGMRFYDVSPDGQRFLMLKGDTQAAPRQLRLVVNWFEELKRLVPAGK